MQARELLDHKYALVRRLGGGASGDVFEAEDLLLGRRVALKRLRPELALQPQNRAAFLEQGRLAARLAHPHIATVLDLGEHGEEAYIAVELLTGTWFQEHIRDAGALSIATTCDLLLQVLAALEHAHAEGLCHGALHPRNVIVVYPRPGVPWVKVTDFARKLPADGRARRAEHAYRAPEAGLVAEDPRSDLFSVGALLYALLGGEAPRVRGDIAQSLRALNPNVPPELAELVAEALSSDPAARPESASELARRLAPHSNPTTLPLSSLQPGAVYVASPPSIRWQANASGVSFSAEGRPQSLLLASDHGSSLGPSCNGPPALRDSCITESLLRNPRFPVSSTGSWPRRWRALWQRHFRDKPHTETAWVVAAASVGAGIACALLAAWMQ